MRLPAPARALCVLGSLVTAIVCPAFAADSTTKLALIPQPLQVVWGRGSAIVSDGTRIVYRDGDEAARFDAENLSQLMARTRGLHLHPVTDQPRQDGLSIRLERRPEEMSEAYSLQVTPSQIVVSAGSDAGLYYGTVTLWQMMTARPNGRGPIRLDAVSIDDKPQLRWRGIMVDSARHMQSIEFLHQLVDWMSLEKLNTLHWHLTDDQAWRLEIKRYPRLTSVGAWRSLPDQAGKIDPGTGKPYPLYGGFYTQAQVRELVAFAARRNVTIVPEIEMPGHATAAMAAYPELSSSPHPPSVPANQYGIFPSLYSPDATSFAFLENVLTEVMDLFPGAYIHIGGDEAIKDEWKASPEIQAEMRAHGITSEDLLQSYFVRQIDGFLTAHGRRTLGWEEILDGGLHANAAVMSWHGVQGGIEAAKQGHDAVLTPVRPLYFDFRQTDAIDELPGRYGDNTLADVYAFDPLPATLTATQRQHILGVQANVWTEYLITDDRTAWMIFPRAAALAEVGWSAAASRSWQSFVARMPSELARYRDLGIPADPNSYRVQIDEALIPTQPQTARVSLKNQVGFGQLRYTTDGSDVTPSSKLFLTELMLPMPVRLRAAAFSEGAMVAGSGVDHALDPATVRKTFSQQMVPCVGDPVIAMEQDPPQGARPMMVANYRDPCWIQKSAQLTGVGSITLEMQTLPWVFEDGPHREPKLLATRNPGGEIDLHLDACDGAVVASFNLSLATESRQRILLQSKLLPLTGVHNLCFVEHRPKLDPLWTLHWSQLQMSEGKQ